MACDGASTGLTALLSQSRGHLLQGGSLGKTLVDFTKLVLEMNSRSSSLSWSSARVRGTDVANIWGTVMVDVPETITGQFIDSNNDGTVDTASYTGTRTSDGNEWYVTNAPMNGVTETVATQKGTTATVKFKLSGLLLTAATTTDLNHGQYVSAAGGGKVAAQKCAGMPLNSKQGK